MAVGMRLFKETYVSRVQLETNRSVQVCGQLTSASPSPPPAPTCLHTDIGSICLGGRAAFVSIVWGTPLCPCLCLHVAVGGPVCGCVGRFTCGWVGARVAQACASNTAVFRLLRNTWKFTDGTSASGTPECLVDFCVDYEFHNAFYSQVRVCNGWVHQGSTKGTVRMGGGCRRAWMNPGSAATPAPSLLSWAC